MVMIGAVVSPRRRPAYRIAVLQNESEALRNPALELGTRLDAIGDWRAELFSERTVDAFLRYQRDFDCVVISYNAAFRTPLVHLLAASELVIGVLVLHQFEVEAPIRLPRGLAYVPAVLDAPAPEARGAEGRDLGREAVLNWPNNVLDKAQCIEAVAECRIEPMDDSPWRPLLEVGEVPRWMVLARAPANNPVPVAVCSLLLDVRRDEHRQLAENLLTYCAAGMPQAAIVSTSESDRGRLVRKLRLRGVHAVELDGGRKLDFGRWPLRGVTDVVLDKTEAATPLPADGPVDAWRTRGGRLVRIQEEGGVSIVVSERDARWVARRWGEWLQARPKAIEQTETSLVSARAYLRALVRIAKLAEAEPSLLGLGTPEQHADRLLALVRKRLKGRPHVDSTISATIAALEVVGFTGADLGSDTTEEIKRWLKVRVAGDTASAEDVFNVARALADEGILKRALYLRPETISASTLTAYEQACVACGRPVTPLPISDASCALAVREVTTSVLAACEHVGARAEARLTKLRSQPETPAEARILDAAIGTLARRNALVRGIDVPADRVEEVCSEAWAFATFLSLDNVPVASLVPPEAFTPGLIEDALREGASLREKNRELQQDRARLQSVRHVFGAVVVGLAVASFAKLAGDRDAFGDRLVLTVGAPAIVLGGLGWGLNLLGLAPRWLLAAGELVLSGFEGLRDAVKRQLERRRAEGT
jgi:hypothetical protein